MYFALLGNLFIFALPKLQLSKIKAGIEKRYSGVLKSQIKKDLIGECDLPFL